MAPPSTTNEDPVLHAIHETLSLVARRPGDAAEQGTSSTQLPQNMNPPRDLQSAWSGDDDF